MLPTFLLIGGDKHSSSGPCRLCARAYSTLPQYFAYTFKYSEEEMQLPTSYTHFLGQSPRSGSRWASAWPGPTLTLCSHTFALAGWGDSVAFSTSVRCPGSPQGPQPTLARGSGAPGPGTWSRAPYQRDLSPELHAENVHSFSFPWSWAQQLGGNKSSVRRGHEAHLRKAIHLSPTSVPIPKENPRVTARPPPPRLPFLYLRPGS